MTRLIRRALLATTAALAGLALQGQPTTAGLLDLDELDDLTSAVLDSSQPSPDQTPIATVLDRTTSIVVQALDDLDAAIPAIPSPGPPVPDAQPAPEPPVLDPDLGSPLPPIADPAVSNPAAAVPPPIGDGGGPPAGDPDSPVEPTPAPNPGPTVATPPGPAISGPADAGAVASGDPARRPPTGGGARDARDRISTDRRLGVRHDADRRGSGVASRRLDDLEPRPDRRHVTRFAQPRRRRGAGARRDVGGVGPDQPCGRRRSAGVTLVIALAAIAASSIVIAVVRRAVSRRGRRAEAAVDREREPTGRASADARPPRRVPPVRASADDRTSRRVPPGRASADARPVRREPRSGVGGHPIDRVGRDRRVPRTPSARSARTHTQRASVTRPPARRTMTA